MMISDVVPDALDGERLDRVVAVLADLTRSRASELVSDGFVTLNGAIVTSRTARVAVGSVVEIDRPDDVLAAPLSADPGVEFGVVFEDADLAVVADCGQLGEPGARKAAERRPRPVVWCAGGGALEVVDANADRRGTGKAAWSERMERGD